MRPARIRVQLSWLAQYLGERVESLAQQSQSVARQQRRILLLHADAPAYCQGSMADSLEQRPIASVKALPEFGDRRLVGAEWCIREW